MSASVLSPPTSANPVERTDTAEPKIAALTTLRFFAAAMIVLFHTRGQMGVPQAFMGSFPLASGVSFFFILSGFILTYVYPSLDRQSAPRFLVARIARIWPMHVTSFVLYLLLIPAWQRTLLSSGTLGTAALNVSLLQAWAPNFRVVSSFNAVSWTLSAELFFYCCFPLMIRAWRRTWVMKIGGVFLLTCIAFVVSKQRVWYFPPPVGNNIVFFNPLALLWQFTVGIAAAHLWRQMRSRVHLSRFAATLLEMAALTATLVAMIACGNVMYFRSGSTLVTGIATSLVIYILYATFAALIGVMALGQGTLSRLLSLRPLVVLGEISFSVYLLHWIFIQYYLTHPRRFAAIPLSLHYVTYWIALLLASYFFWRVVEFPCRRLILALWNRRFERTQHVAENAAGVRVV